MSTIKINELATTDIALTDFIAKADANGLMTKNTVSNLSAFFETVGEVGFKGSVLIADDPTEDGWYLAGEAGTFPNIGGLVALAQSVTIFVISDSDTTYSKIDIPLTLPFDSVPTEGSTNAVESGGVFNYVGLFPYNNDNNPTGSSSKLSKEQCIKFVYDIEIYDDYETDKKYTISSILRNFSGTTWSLRIAKTDSDGSSNSTDILSFLTTTNPEDGSNITEHELTSYGNSKLKGKIRLKWDEIPDGSNFFSMTPALGYELNYNVFKGYKPDYTSRALTQDVRVLEEGNFLTAEQVDNILISLNLKNSDDNLNYGLSVVKKGYTSSGNKNAIDIFSENSGVVSQYAIYRNDDATAKTGVEEIELLSATGDLLGTAVINWDAITTDVLFNLGTALRYDGYIFRKSFYKNKSTDLTNIISNYETIYDAVQNNEKGRINVGLNTLLSYDVATDVSDFKNIEENRIISDLYNNQYINTYTCKLLLIDKKGIMWWRLATNAGVSIYTCSIQEFKDSLVDETNVNGENRKSIEAYTIGNAPTFLTLFQILNVTCIRESQGRYIAQDNLNGDSVGTFYYLDEDTNQFTEATIPVDGRKGELRSSWGFDFYENMVVSTGYNLTRGIGALLYSDDYGQTYKNIFDVATTGNFTSTERPDAHLHGCFIDKFDNNRVYLITGDYSYEINGEPTSKIFYTDNPSDVTPVWNKAPIDFVGSSEDNEQYISGFATSKNVLFGCDMRNNSIMRMNKNNSTHSKREVAEVLSTETSGVWYVPGEWSRENENEPLFCFNSAGDEATTNNISSNIYATMDGIKFYKVWQDTVYYSPFYSLNNIIQSYKGELYTVITEGTNARFTNGLTLLLSNYEVY